MNNRRTEPAMATFLHSRGDQLGLPIGGNFELTARCNFNCPMCYVHLSQADVDARGRELTAEQWISIARQARDQGLIFALLTGGEPFVRKDFFEIYGAMKAMGLLVSINSNGSMLSGDILQRLLEDPPFRINISLYGGCEETYRNMCGQNAFERVITAIRALKAAGVDVRLNLSITPYNRKDLDRIFELAMELQVHVKASAYMYPPIRVNGDCGHRLTAEEAAEAAVRWDQLRLPPEDFVQRAKNMSKLICVEQNECGADLDEGVSCRAGRTSFWITWDGKMRPCGMMPGPEVYPLEQGFAPAWEMLRAETKKIKCPSACVVCKYREVCSVCAAVCVTETGRFDGVPEYMCRMARATVRATQAACEERSGQIC